MDVSLVLPAHRGWVHDHRQRIHELLSHHRQRLDQIIEILTVGPKTAYQVAAEMTWNLNVKSWNDFPDEQKLFATSEVIAHLKYLENKGQLKTNQMNGRIYYQLR
jgi:hypothetical protein